MVGLDKDVDLLKTFRREQEAYESPRNCCMTERGSLSFKTKLPLSAHPRSPSRNPMRSLRVICNGGFKFRPFLQNLRIPASIDTSELVALQQSVKATFLGKNENLDVINPQAGGSNDIDPLGQAQVRKSLPSWGAKSHRVGECVITTRQMLHSRAYICILECANTDSKNLAGLSLSNSCISLLLQAR